MQNKKAQIGLWAGFVHLVVCSMSMVHLVSAKPLMTLQELQSKPKGVVRDFYVWDFINSKETSLAESIQAYKLVSREITKLKTALYDKGFHPEIPKSVACTKLSFKELKQKDVECITYGLRISQIPMMDKADVAFLKKKLANNPKLLRTIEILRSPKIANAMFASNAQTFAEIFNALSYQQKLEIFASGIEPSAIKKLANENKSAFNNVLQKIILDSAFGHFKQAISAADITSADANTLFLLGINEVLYGKTKDALKYFARSKDATINPFFRDRAIFWQYLVSNNELYLHDLQTSTFIDIFSIYANQKLKTTPKFKIVSSFDINSKNESKEPPLDIKDPFAWQIQSDKIISIKNTELYEKSIRPFYHSDTVPHLAFFSNRLTKYSVNYYIMPYVDLMQWRDDAQKAMSLAIAKQESGFLPALVSRSYALGMMQIMPFNVEPFAKKLGLSTIRLDSMFDPALAYRFGTMFLDELNAEFKHPLFVAYAYNGGPGALRRTLEKKRLFLKNRNYEPWLSLELIPSEETRFYGMKVRANYINYQQLLGNDIEIETLLKQTLRY